MDGYNGSGYVQAESPDVFKLLLQASKTTTAIQ